MNATRSAGTARCTPQPERNAISATLCATPPSKTSWAAEGSTKKDTASSSNKTEDHYCYTLTLHTSDIVFTRISHGPGKPDDPKLIREIFREQLIVTEEDFHLCVEKEILPPRPQDIPDPPGEGLEAKLGRNLLHKVGLSQSQVAEMTKLHTIDA